MKRTILIGSADRGTLIRSLDDVDVMAEFTNKDNIFEQYRHNSGAFLQRIRTALQASTSIASIGARGQAVRLFYTSGAHVDIAPTFKWSSGGFALPSGEGGWITTDPEVQATWMAGRREVLGSHLTPIVKIAKRWNRVHSSRLSSYHVEVMTATMFGSLSGNYRDAMKCWFDWAPQYLDVNDPAGHSGSLGTSMTYATRTALKSRLAEAKTRAVKALAEEAAGNHTEAKRLWKIELGDEFYTT
ncbi:MAG TPA: hypothetical protein VNQ33_00670 [Acidimicrobiales bacterium]|nr:hypothetical protein [Acidimicrobiales bacterium]